MIKSDREYSITRYWKRIFHRAANQYSDFEQNATDVMMAESYRSMDDELSEEMRVYLTETGKADEDFPDWAPEKSGETAVLVKY
jgi:hypothetical protein